MSTNKPLPKKDRPEIVKLNSAFELAKKWVNNMTEPAEDEPIVIQSRPARLGLGATVPRPSQFVPSDDPLERKLHYKLNAAKINAAKAAEDSALAAKDDDNDDEDEDLDSRTSAFGKKRAAVPVSPPLQAKKKQK